jgi:hypothetical protein
LLILLGQDGFTVSQPEKSGILRLFRGFSALADRGNAVAERRFAIRYAKLTARKIVEKREAIVN